MKTMVAILAAFALAGTAVAAPIPSPASQSPQQPTFTCEQVVQVSKTIEAAPDFVAVDAAMVSVGFNSLSSETFATMFGGDLTIAKTKALNVLKNHFAGLNCKW